MSSYSEHVGGNRVNRRAFLFQAGVLGAAPLLASRSASPSAPFSGTPEVKLYPAPSGTPRSHDYIVKVNGQAVDLYGTMTRWGSTATFGYFDFNGEVQIDITANFGPTSGIDLALLPEKYGIHVARPGSGRITFTLSRPAKLTVVTETDYQGRVLHLFANDIERDVPDPKDPNVIYFRPGYHEVGKIGDRAISVKGNQTLYIAGGAWVLGSMRAEKATGIKVRGRGILAQDESCDFAPSLYVRECADADISGVIVHRRKPTSWSGLIERSNHVRVHDYKVVSPAIWSTDGLNVMNCSDVVYEDCFFRAGDDNIAIKGIVPSDGQYYADGNPKDGPPNRDIVIRGCTFWSDNGNAIVLGQESQAASYENISVRDCDVLFVRDEHAMKAALSIICLTATEFRNIRFEEIRVGPSGQLIAIVSTDHVYSLKGNQDWPGEINGVSFRNISARGSGSKRIAIRGWSSDKKVRNVTLDNVVVNGERVNPGSRYVVANSYVEGLVIR